MNQIERIIVPIDFSDQSLIALRQSYNLAKFNNAEIILMHVIDKGLFERLNQFSIGKENYENLLEEGINEKLEEIAQEPKEKGITVSTIVKNGKIYEEISNYAEDKNGCIIIMGTRGTIGFKKKVIGTNAMRVIKMAPCPVITIHGTKHKDGCDKIVLPLDLTKESKQKVTGAIEMARSFDATIIVVTVSDSGDEFIVNKLKRQLQQVTELIKKHDVSCKSEWIEGEDIPQEILKYSKQIDADLIMVMTQQETNWIDFFIGSSAQEIINNSEIPVLSIRPKKMKDLTEFVVQ